MEYAVAVIDIGMTNKKVAVYDENLHQLDAVYKTFEPLKVREPDTGSQVEAHDLAGMEDWFFEQLRTFAQKYPIKALSVTTHGATFVCIDKDGKVCVPSILYTHEPGEQFQNEFYKKCGADKREYKRWKNHEGLKPIFEEDRAYINDWIPRRIATLDRKYNYDAAGIASAKAASPILVFPSPVGVYITSSVDATVNVYDVSGRLYKRVSVNSGGTTVSLPSGVYIVERKKYVVK